mgnify:CR=1 FL=1|jgi:endonuclease IV
MMLTPTIVWQLGLSGLSIEQSHSQESMNNDDKVDFSWVSTHQPFIIRICNPSTNPAENSIQHTVSQHAP